MPVKVKVRAHEAIRAAGKFKRFLVDFRRQVEGAVSNASAATVSESRAHTPVFTGRLANSIQASGVRTLYGRAGEIVVQDVVQSSTPYAVVLENGRRPGSRMPPDQPIRRWVTLKTRRGQFDLDVRPGESFASAVERATFALRRSIAKKGIKARRFIAKGARLGRVVLARELDGLVKAWIAAGGYR